MKTDGETATVAEREAAAAAAGQAALVLLRKEQEARINAEARADEAEARGAEVEAAGGAPREPRYLTSMVLSLWALGLGPKPDPLQAST